MTTTIAPGSVIAAVDGSADARDGVRWAAEQARLEGRPLVVLHATGERRPARRTEHVRDAGALVAEMVALAHETRPDLRVTGASMPGNPRQALVAASSAAHLLVLGSRGRGAVSSKLLGSVSADVAKHADCPVVVVRPTSPGALKDGVVVGADGTPDSVRVIEFAFLQASLRGLPLTVMHCVYDGVAAVVGAVGPAYGYADADDAHRVMAESVAGLREKYPDVHLSTQLHRGPVEECLRSGPRPWNLVVVGRHPVRTFDPSLSTAVLERSRSVVAVVPVAPGRQDQGPL